MEAVPKDDKDDIHLQKPFELLKTEISSRTSRSLKEGKILGRRRRKRARSKSRASCPAFLLSKNNIRYGTIRKLAVIVLD